MRKMVKKVSSKPKKSINGKAIKNLKEKTMAKKGTKKIIRNSTKKVTKGKVVKKIITKKVEEPEEKVVTKSLPVVHAPKVSTSKPGFFGRLFGFSKKEKVLPGMEKINAVKKLALTEKKDRSYKDGVVKTGIAGFDSLFDKDGGIPVGSSVLIEGGPGSGKTVFCLTTLANLCEQGKKCLYMSFEEPEEKLIQHMEEFGWPANVWIKKGLLRVVRFDALDVSRSIEALLSAAKKELLIEVDPVFFPQDFEPDFIAMDSLTAIASAFSGQESRFRIYMEQLFRYLEKNKITNFLIREVSSPSHIGSIFTEQGEAVSFLSDGIIVIYNVIYDSGDRSSAIEILKMRGMSFQRKIIELTINSKGGALVNSKKILKKKSKNSFKLT